MPKKTGRVDPLEFFTSMLSQNIKKMEGGPFGIKYFAKKIPTMPKKLEVWTFWNFLTSIPSQNIKNIEAGTLW